MFVTQRCTDFDVLPAVLHTVPVRIATAAEPVTVVRPTARLRAFTEDEPKPSVRMRNAPRLDGATYRPAAAKSPANNVSA